MSDQVKEEDEDFKLDGPLKMERFTPIPEGGCIIKDVSFDELAGATCDGGWAVVSAYYAKWKASYREESRGMRYVIACLAPETAMGTLRKELESVIAELKKSATEKDKKLAELKATADGAWSQVSALQDKVRELEKLIAVTTTPIEVLAEGNLL